MANQIRIRASVDDKASGTVDRIRDKFGKLREQGAKGFAIGAGAAITAKGLSMVDAAITSVSDSIVGAISDASDLNESMSKIGAVFGDQAADIEKWASNSATAFGLSKQAALEAAGTYGNLFQAFGLGRQESAKMSESLVQLASDLASFNNTSVDDAIQALRSGLSGETEPLKRFGVALNDARMRAELASQGVKDLGAVLTPAQKATAAYAIIMHDTALAQGDFARTSDQLANSQRILDAKLKDLSAKFGSVLLPVVTAATNAFSAGVDAAVFFGEKVGGLIDFLKPGLIGLAVVIAATVVPAFAAWAAAAAAAAAATIAAFLPVLAPIAAIAVAVAGVSMVVNNLAMDFGDMGARIHKIADETGRSYDDVKEAIKRDMAETGASFDEAAGHVERAFNDTADASANALRQETRDMQQFAARHHQLASQIAQELPEAVKQQAQDAGAELVNTGGMWAAKLKDGTTVFLTAADLLAGKLPDAIQRAHDKAVEIVRLTPADLAKSLLQGQKDWQQAVDDYNQTVEDNLMAPAEVKALEEQVKQAGKDLTRALKSGDPEWIAAAQAKYDAVWTRLWALKNNVPQLALQTGQSYADALAQKQREVGKAAAALKQAAINNTRLNLYDSGFKVGHSWVSGFIQALTYGLPHIATAARDATSDLRGKSPPKTGPLREIDKWGYNVGSAWTDKFMQAIRDMNLGSAVGGIASAMRSVPLPGMVPAMTPAAVGVASGTAPREIHIHLQVMGDVKARDPNEIVAAVQRVASFIDGGLAGG